MYRTKGMKENPYSKRQPMYKGISVHYEAYEAGADAYEEGLKKEGTIYSNITGKEGVLFTIPEGKGHLVFIPEGE